METKTLKISGTKVIAADVLLLVHLLLLLLKQKLEITLEY